MKKDNKSIVKALLWCILFLVFIILLENVTRIFPHAPRIFKPTSQLFTVLKKTAVYALVAVSMNLLNGFTGLFSLGQAGFMLLGAYTYAILTVPAAERDSVYYLFDGSAIRYSIQDILGKLFGTSSAGSAVSLVLGVLIAIFLAGCVAAFFAWLIGLPVLRLKSDYLAIATLGPITNGANMIKSFPTFTSFNIKMNGRPFLYLSTFFPFFITTVCIFIMVLLVNSTYGRAFKAIRDDEIAAEAMGINLAKHKMMSFVISSFFSGVGGALFAMYAANAQAKVYTSVMTYEILLIVVIGGIGSISGSCIATFLYVACSEWWLRFLDAEAYIGEFKVPFMRNGFRMVVFSVIIMIVVLFFRRGIMGDKELPDLLRQKKKSKSKEAAS